MTGEKKNQGKSGTRRRKKKLPGMVFSFLSLAAVIYIAIFLLSGQEADFSRLTNLFRSRTPVALADEFDFDIGGERVFASIGDTVAAAGTFGVQVLDLAGGEIIKDYFRMTSPAIKTVAGRGIIFDIGGTELRCISETQITASVKTTGTIISASINRNGWFCVCSQEGGAYLSVVDVYDNRGREVYKVSLSSGYAVNAAISPDNKRLAVLTLTGEGSIVTFYELSGEVPGGSYVYPGGLILDITYPANGKVLAVTQDSLVAIGHDGAGDTIYSFAGRNIGGYTTDGGFIALYLLDYNVGFNGRLVTLREDGEVLRELISDREIVSMSAGNGYLAVLRNDGLSFYSTVLNEYPIDESSPSAAGASIVVALGGSAALAAGDHFAVTIKFERSTGQ